MIIKAEQFARIAHKGQYRKYTGEPYIVHPEAVARKVASVVDDPVMIAAAWLHDVVEDTAITIDVIEFDFGHEVASLVALLTNDKNGNRKSRKAAEIARFAVATPKAKTIKLADILDNIPSIIEHDPDFAIKYVIEKRMLLKSLIGGDRTLYAAAEQLIDGYIFEDDNKTKYMCLIESHIGEVIHVDDKNITVLFDIDGELIDQTYEIAQFTDNKPFMKGDMLEARIQMVRLQTKYASKSEPTPKKRKNVVMLPRTF